MRNDFYYIVCGSMFLSKHSLKTFNIEEAGSWSLSKCKNIIRGVNKTRNKGSWNPSSTSNYKLVTKGLEMANEELVTTIDNGFCEDVVEEMSDEEIEIFTKVDIEETNPNFIVINIDNCMEKSREVLDNYSSYSIDVYIEKILQIDKLISEINEMNSDVDIVKANMATCLTAMDHMLENSNFSSVKGYLHCKLRKELRRKRRDAKNITTLSHNSYIKSLIDSNIGHFNYEIDKIKNYKPYERKVVIKNGYNLQNVQGE